MRFEVKLLCLRTRVCSVCFTQLYAQCDAVNGARRDLGVGFVSTDPEAHTRVGWYDGGGTQGFTQPAMGTTLVHFHSYLQYN